MQENLNKILKDSLHKIENASSLEELSEVTNLVTGKKSELSNILKSLGQMDVEDRKKMGMMATEIKQKITESISKKEEELIDLKSVLDEKIDLTLPGKLPESGALHPVTQIMYDLNDTFLSLGFEVYSENEISSEKYAFDNLNFAKDHPARECMDTYWIEGTEEKSGKDRLCLRPHLTGASVRYLLKNGAPARFVYPGSVFRNETTDARHERTFYQYEALIVDKNISFTSGKVLIDAILEKVFGRKIKTRMREGFFPFTEPGYEIDMECQVCKGKGCSVCHHSGWIEIMPGGIIHPNVLKSANLNPDEWTGFYVNIGLDRLVMMRYEINDVRLLRSGDLRFLKQFK